MKASSPASEIKIFRSGKEEKDRRARLTEDGKGRVGIALGEDNEVDTGGELQLNGNVVGLFANGDIAHHSNTQAHVRDVHTEAGNGELDGAYGEVRD